jgi:hypothetical protein
MSTPPHAKELWDAAAEEERWRRSLNTAKQMQEKFGEGADDATGFAFPSGGEHLKQYEPESIS